MSGRGGLVPLVRFELNVESPLAGCGHFFFLFRQSSFSGGLEHGWLSTNGKGKCRGLHHHSCEIPSPKNGIVKTEVAGFQVSVVARVMMNAEGTGLKPWGCWDEGSRCDCVEDSAWEVGQDPIFHGSGPMEVRCLWYGNLDGRRSLKSHFEA